MTRRVAILATLVGGAALGATAAGTWVTARAWTPIEERELAVTGLDAAPVLGATALLLLAAGVALAMAGRVAVRLTAVAVAGAAGLAAASTLVVLVDPAGPARSAAQAALGVAAVEGAAVTALVWPALLVALACVGLGVWVLVAGGSWPHGASRGASRYRRATDDAGPADGRAAAAGGTDDVSAWDALSRGEDPT